MSESLTGHLAQTDQGVKVVGPDRELHQIPKLMRRDVFGPDKAAPVQAVGMQVSFTLDDNGRVSSLELLEDRPRVEARNVAAEERAVRHKQQHQQVAPARDRRGGGPRHNRGRQGQQRPAAPDTNSLNGDRFRNPYNFIPVRSRPTIGPLADRRPGSHGRYHDAHWSGRIGVRITTESPLLLNDGLKTTGDKHKTNDLRVGADGQPRMAATSLKGAVRSAVESVTHSRLGAPTIRSRISRRQKAATEAAALVPARVLDDDRLLLLCGTSDVGDYRERMYAAWLPMYRNGGTSFKDRNFSHGQEVAAVVRQRTHNRPRFDYWEVAAVRDIADKDELAAKGQDLVVTGWLSITGNSFSRKHDERLFFSTLEERTIPITESLRKQWRELIEDWDRQDEGQTPRKSGNGNAWSRHRWDGDLSERSKLKAGDLVYLKLKDGVGAADQAEAAFPVMIGRALFEKAPSDLFAEAQADHATHIDGLSMADRMFGWVRQYESSNETANTTTATGGDDGDRDDENFDQVAAYRGRVRIAPVRCQTDDAIRGFGKAAPPLATLNSPKPTSARWYAAAGSDGRPFDQGERTPDYSTGVRGRKAYLTHPDYPDGYWDPDSRVEPGCGLRKEWLHQGDEKHRRGETNRSVKAWVKPGVVFETEVGVKDLSAVELGALLYVLGIAGEGRKLLLGGGRPLGFGRVSVEIDWGRTQLADTRELLAQLTALDAEAPSGGDAAATVELFKSAVADAAGASFDDVPHIRAFRRATTPTPLDDSPIRYPRAGRNSDEPHPQGKQFEYFVENERLSGGQAANGYALPALDGSDDAPTIPALTRTKGRR